MAEELETLASLEPIDNKNLLQKRKHSIMDRRTVS